MPLGGRLCRTALSWRPAQDCRLFSRRSVIGTAGVRTTVGSGRLAWLITFFNNASTNARGHPGSRANLGRSRALAQPPVQKSGKKKRSRRHRQRRGAERREADGVAFFSPKRRHHEARWALSRRRCHSCQAQFMEFLAGFAAVNNTGARSSRVQPNFAATSGLAPSLASTTVAEARTHRHTYYTERIGSNVASRRPGVERRDRKSVV